MSVVWSYFWPMFAAALVIGAIAGSLAFRAPRSPSNDGPTARDAVLSDWRRRRLLWLIGGVAASLAAAALWHGPLGAADRFVTQVERSARRTLVEWEMTQVSGHLHRGPLTRELVLSGSADDFQRSELVRIMGGISGVRRATWSPSEGGVPLIVEALASAIAGFLLGLLLAYLVELRRRYNSQWKW